MSNRLPLYCLCAALCGCLSHVVSLDPKAEHVTVVHETDRPLHCKVLGKISGMSRSGDEKDGSTGAQNDFRNHAAELKANFALVETERSGQVGTGSQRDYYLGGKALQCQTEEMEEAEEKKEAAERDAKEQQEDAEKQKEAAEKPEPSPAKSQKKKK